MSFTTCELNSLLRVVTLCALLNYWGGTVSAITLNVHNSGISLATKQVHLQRGETIIGSVKYDKTVSNQRLPANSVTKSVQPKVQQHGDPNLTPLINELARKRKFILRIY